MTTAEIKFDVPGVQARIEKRLSRVQHDLDQRILQDSNLFAPRDVGNLIDSSIIASRPGTGMLIWATPYARAQYYGLPNKATDKNPRARMKWFEAAKSQYSEEWEKLANDKYNS